MPVPPAESRGHRMNKDHLRRSRGLFSRDIRAYVSAERGNVGPLSIMRADHYAVSMNDHQKRRSPHIVSAIGQDGSLIETVHASSEQRVQLCIFEGDTWTCHDRAVVNGRDVIPYSPHNNLIQHGVVLFPSVPAEYGSTEDLVAELRAFIHRYVDVSATFETVATYYVLLSWVYDAFNELPYLRVRGDFGTGKTRFLLTVGSLCYKPIFASGASTVSPLFRILDAFQGTLVLDESDFRLSDERAEIVKILNNGTAHGFPVLRSEVNGKHEYDPRAYTVYGPKVIGTRGLFQDRALESRCITEDLGFRSVRDDIPLSLPSVFHVQALELRNKLLLYRFRNRHRLGDLTGTIDRELEPRISQIYAPLLATVADDGNAEQIRELARASSSQLVQDRGMDVEAQVLEVLHDLVSKSPDKALPLGQVAVAFSQRFGDETDWKANPRWIGGVLRRRLQLRPYKSHGAYVLPVTECVKLKRLFERYGITESKEHDRALVDEVDA